MLLAPSLAALIAAAPAATPPAAPPAEPATRAPARAATRHLPREDYVAEVERQAQERGVQITWVNPPERRVEVVSRTVRLRGTLPAREDCYGPGCPEDPAPEAEAE